MPDGEKTWAPKLLRRRIKAVACTGPKSGAGGGPRLRQLIESLFDKLLNTFRLARERPHALTGFQARLAAKISLHNFCSWLNGLLQRAPLAFADLVDW